jgi:hypothetical protein
MGLLYRFLIAVMNPLRVMSLIFPQMSVTARPVSLQMVSIPDDPAPGTASAAESRLTSFVAAALCAAATPNG